MSDKREILKGIEKEIAALEELRNNVSVEIFKEDLKLDYDTHVVWPFGATKRTGRVVGFEATPDGPRAKVCIKLKDGRDGAVILLGKFSGIKPCQSTEVIRTTKRTSRS